MAWIVGLDLKAAGSLTALDFVIKAVLMYYHELAWQGKMKSKNVSKRIFRDSK